MSTHRHRGVTRFRRIAGDLYRFGGGVYARYQPQFLDEYIRDHADAWFPNEARASAARRLCRGCPVADSCLKYALDNIDLDGIWGGSTHADRKHIRNKAAA